MAEAARVDFATEVRMRAGMNPTPASSRALTLLRAFSPPHLAFTRRDMGLGSVGMAIALVFTELLCRQAGLGAPWFIAPMAATALLVFFMPASPMAQPWPVLAGSCLSATVGVACFLVLGASGMAAALAAAIATALMFALRCLHPPGAAVAVTAVLGSEAVHAAGWGYALWPVGANALCLVLLGLVLNNVAARRYPHHHARPAPEALLPAQPDGILPVDVDAALASFDELLDIDREDLEEIIARAQAHARERQAADRAVGPLA